MIESEAEYKALEAEIMEEDFSGDVGGDTQSHEKNKTFVGAEQCAGFCGAVFSVVASRKGEKWALSKEEAKALGGALDPVLAKYLPSVGALSAEAALLAAMAAIILPRILDNNDVSGQGATVGDS